MSGTRVPPRVAAPVVALLAMALAMGGCGTARRDYIAAQQGGAGLLDGGADGGATAAVDGGDDGEVPSIDPMAIPADPAQVAVQLDTFFGAGGAGMYDAVVSGLYEQVAVEAGFLPGTPDEDPIAAMLAEDGPPFLLASVPGVLRARERDGSDLVLIALLYRRSGTLLIAPRGTRLDPLSKLRGASIGLLDVAGRGLDVRAALAAAGLEAGAGYEPVGGYDVVLDPGAVPSTGLLRSGAVAALQGTTYDELAQVQEFPTEDGDAPYAAADLTIRSLDVSGDALLSEGLFARSSWLADPTNRATAVRFLAATFAGYADCRDHVDDCAQLVVDQGAPLPFGHQQWAVNEVNALIWPAPGGIGDVPAGAFDETVRRLVAAGILAGPPDAGAVDTSLAAEARAGLSHLDLEGAGYRRSTVAITPGGEGAAPQSPPPDDDEELPSAGG